MSTPQFPPPDKPPPTVGALLRLAWLQFRQRLDDHVRAAGFTDLTPAQLLLFRYPTIEGMRPGQLAEQMGMTKQGVNDLLRQMEALGYLRRGERDPTDGRARLISLTNRGREVMDLTYAASAKVAEEWAQLLGRDGYEALRETLLRVVTAATEEAPVR